MEHILVQAVFFLSWLGVALAATDEPGGIAAAVTIAVLFFVAGTAVFIYDQRFRDYGNADEEDGKK